MPVELASLSLARRTPRPEMTMTMIKPSDVKTPTAPPVHNQANIDACEADFDAAIRRAEDAGVWPATVRDTRDGMPTAVIALVVQRYVDAGWTASVGGARGVRATIDLPHTV